MKTRPNLSRGDLVRLNKKHINSIRARHALSNEVLNQAFKVVRGDIPDRRERRALDIMDARRGAGGGYQSDATDGATYIHVKSLDGKRWCFQRRHLWRIPNQPRDKY